MVDSPKEIPELTEAQIREVVEKLYGLNVRKIKTFSGYFDKNYYIEVDDQFSNQNILRLCPEGYVFKVVNSLDSKNTDMFAAQIKIMKRLSENNFPVQAPVLTSSGVYYSMERVYANGVLQKDAKEHTKFSEFMVRIVTFIPGTIFDEVNDVTPELLFEIGATCARMDRVIEDIECKMPQTIWDLTQAYRVRKYMHAIADPIRRQLVSDVFTDLESVLTHFQKLKKVMIHGDFSEQNILIDTVIDTDGNKVARLSGILDFGCINTSYRVVDVAIMMAYCSSSVAVANFDVLEVCAQCLAGYLSYAPLNDLEMSMVPVLVAARYAQSLVMGAHAYSRDPSNDYVLVTARRGWIQLAELRKYTKEDLLIRLKERISIISNGQ
ncbi:hydroxylysine kinase-like [Tubulanus polymorphus]|uniref:hydroxylysine kinase-like n=1 Tax=Tubulanus polymorphus TaxID=672921 RepID=UPI003DA6B905